MCACYKRCQYDLLLWIYTFAVYKTIYFCYNAGCKNRIQSIRLVHFHSATRNTVRKPPLTTTLYPLHRRQSQYHSNLNTCKPIRRLQGHVEWLHNDYRSLHASLGIGRPIRWRLYAQPTKTKLVHFSDHLRRKQKTPLTVTIDRQAVLLANKAEYLGVTCNQSLNFLNCKNCWETAQIIQNQALKAALRVPQYTSIRYIYEKRHESNLFEFCSQASIRYLNNAIQHRNSRILNVLQEILKLKNITNLPRSPLLPFISPDWNSPTICNWFNT